MSDPGIRGIIFDLDGTLYHMRWYMHPLLAILVAPRIQLLPRYMSVRKKYCNQDLGNGQILLHTMAADLARCCKGLQTDQALSWIHRHFYPAFVAMMPLFRGSRPGLHNLLSSLQHKGVRMAVLSDFARIRERLRGLSIDASLFDPILSSEECGSLKPHPRPFQQIAAQWSLPPQEILVVGDRDDTDGEAARLCGMQFLQISDRHMVGRKRWPEVCATLPDLVAGT